LHPANFCEFIFLSALPASIIIIIILLSSYTPDVSKTAVLEGRLLHHFAGGSSKLLLNLLLMDFVSYQDKLVLYKYDKKCLKHHI